MSSSTRPERPNRLVMGLGIATIVLFSVNLLAMLSQRVWPKLQDLELFESESAQEEAPPVVEFQDGANDDHAIYSFVAKKRKRCRHKHHGIHSVEINIDRSIDTDLDRLEREIRREMDRLDVDLSDAKSDLEEAIALKLHVDQPNTFYIQRGATVSELGKRMSDLKRTFEIRAEEHEDAARTAYKRVRVRRDR